MRYGFVLAACAAASIGESGALAQAVEVPGLYIPPPPMQEPQFEVGARYWQSVGKTRFSINSSKVDPSLGNPTSVLTYDEMDGYSGEFFWYAENDGGTFARVSSVAAA